MSRSTYIPRESSKLLNFYCTVDRKRGTTRLWMVGNTISRVCPYINDWDLHRIISTQKQGTIVTKEMDGSDGEKIIQQLSEADIPAVRIGTLETTRDKVIQNGDEVRYLDRPQADTLGQFLYERALSKGTFN
jgi:hypothetical protein